MADGSKEKHNAKAAASQHEADAQAVREKTARLRALRLAHEAANKPAGGATAASGRAAPKKKSGKSAKSGGTGQSLSEWLANQQKEGRNN